MQIFSNFPPPFRQSGDLRFLIELQIGTVLIHIPGHKRILAICQERWVWQGAGGRRQGAGGRRQGAWAWPHVIYMHYLANLLMQMRVWPVLTCGYGGGGMGLGLGLGQRLWGWLQTEEQGAAGAAGCGGKCVWKSPPSPQHAPTKPESLFFLGGGDNWHSQSQLIIIAVRSTNGPQINQNQSHKRRMQSALQENAKLFI